MFDIPLPPAEFAGQYAGHLVEIVEPIARVQATCGRPSVGCALLGPGWCVIILPEVSGPITGQIQVRIRAHEIGHCNGWPAEHPR